MIKHLHATLAFTLVLVFQNALLAQAPPNDNCADAIAINGETIDLPFSTVNANTDGPAHPDNCPSSGATPDSLYNDVWYRFTPDWSGLAEFSVCGTADFDTKIMVYGPGAACPPDVGDVVACNEDGAGCSGFTSKVVFPVESGQTYLLRLGGWGSGSPGEEGEGTLSVTEFIPTVANDFCNGAIELVLDANDSIYVEFENLGATNGPPDHLVPQSCFTPGETTVYNDIWYVWTATFTDGLEWSNCGTSNFDSRMAVYESATCPPPVETLVGCGDDDPDPNSVACPGFTSRALFNVEEGKTYLFRLGGWSSGDAGDGSFFVKRIPLIVPPANDPCETPNEAYIITEQQADDFEVLFEGVTTFASAQPENPNPHCRPDGEFRDLWYSFNSGENTEVNLRFNKVSTGAEFIIDIFEACGVPADTNWCIRSDEQNNTFFDVTFTGFPGVPTEYLVRVATRVTSDNPGDFWFQLVGIPYSGLDDLQVEHFRFFPNPAREQANMSFRIKEPLESQAEVVNTLGQVVQRVGFGRLPAGEQSLSFSTANLEKGIYFLRLLAEGRQKTVRFVKQ